MTRYLSIESSKKNATKMLQEQGHFDIRADEKLSEMTIANKLAILLSAISKSQVIFRGFLSH